MASCERIVSTIPNDYSLIHLVEYSNRDEEQDTPAIEVSIEKDDLLKEQTTSSPNAVEAVENHKLAKRQSSKAAGTLVSPGANDVSNRRKQLAPMKWCDSDEEKTDSQEGRKGRTRQSDRDDSPQVAPTTNAPHGKKQHGPRSSSPRKSRPNEAERLFRSLNNLEMAALYVRNRPSTGPPSSLEATVGKKEVNEVRVGKSHKAAAASSEAPRRTRSRSQPSPAMQANANLRALRTPAVRHSPRKPHSRSHLEVPLPVPSSPLDTGEVRRYTRSAKRLKAVEKPLLTDDRVPMLEDESPLPPVEEEEERSRSLRKRGPAIPTSQLPSSDPSISGLGSVNGASCTERRSNAGLQSSADSSRSTHTRTTTSSTNKLRRTGHKKNGKKTLPKVTAYKSTFSFDNVFFGNNDDSHSSTGHHKNHYLHKWTINKYYPGGP